MDMPTIKSAHQNQNNGISHISSHCLDLAYGVTHKTTNVTLSSLECDILQSVLVPHYAGSIGIVCHIKQDDNVLCIPPVTNVAVFWVVPSKKIDHTDKNITHIFIKLCAPVRVGGLNH